MARKVLKYLNAFRGYRRGIIPPLIHYKSDHEDFSSSSSSSSSSDEDITVEEKFANTRLTPPRTHLKRKRKKAVTSPKISSAKKHDKFAKTSALHSRAKVNNNDTKVIHPVLPITVYELIKEAVDIMDRPGWPNGGLDEHHLSCCEIRIDVDIRYFRQFLPAGWKYERDNARSLIAGYDRVFNDDRCTFIV